MFRKILKIGMFSILSALFLFTCIAQDQVRPKGFAINDRMQFNHFPNFHGGVGTIKYSEYYGPNDYKSQHHFLRLVVMPPKTSIGEYKLVDSDETIALLNGHAYVTVNDVTMRLNSLDCIKCGLDDKHGLYNNGTEDLVVFFTNQPKPGVERSGRCGGYRRRFVLKMKVK